MTNTNKRIEHTGVVHAVDGSRVLVNIEQQSGCAACGARNMCGTSESRDRVIEARAVGALQAGDEVMVYGEQSLGLRAVLWAFVVPFAVLLTAVVVLNRLLDNEAVAGTLAICSLIPYYIVLRLMRGRLDRKFVFYAVRQAADEKSETM
ncbi:MAG: SoxR reducing system RseC family protein [Paludibacteraceae bacterium]|nr:SoxR reducing system RseC family protein [Paludibacteraceae bacterium]